MDVKNLHEKKDWDDYYTSEQLIHVKLKSGLLTSYDIFLCDSLLSKYLPFYKGSKNKKPIITEIGSGDGKLLRKLANMFGYTPIGIEYSSPAAKIAEKNGVKTIVTDVFDKNFLKKYKNHFDVVFSYGFIEHIMPPEKAVKLHLDLVKPGGYFVIQIPRFKGFNYWRIKFFMPELIPAHNLTIMNEEVLDALCSMPQVEKIYCGNYGTFKLRLPMDKKSVKGYLLKLICNIEYISNPLFRLLFKDKGFETRFFSPAVMFIGRKK